MEPYLTALIFGLTIFGNLILLYSAISFTYMAVDYLKLPESYFCKNTLSSLVIVATTSWISSLILIVVFMSVYF